MSFHWNPCNVADGMTCSTGLLPPTQPHIISRTSNYCTWGPCDIGACGSVHEFVKGGLHHYTFKVQSGCVRATLIKGLQLIRIQSPVWIEGYRFWILRGGEAWWKRNDCVKSISGSFFIRGDGATPWVMRNKRHSWEVQNCFRLVNSDQSYCIMGQ